MRCFNSLGLLPAPMYSVLDTLAGGFPHSEIPGSKPVRGSPELIAAYYVLHRLSTPRHPPNALLALDLYSFRHTVIRKRRRRYFFRSHAPLGATHDCQRYARSAKTLSGFENCRANSPIRYALTLGLGPRAWWPQQKRQSYPLYHVKHRGTAESRSFPPRIPPAPHLRRTW